MIATTTKIWLFRTAFCLLLTAIASMAYGQPPLIKTPANNSIAQGHTYKMTPRLISGAKVTWTKEYGPDDMAVDPATGAVSWAIPASLPRESFHLGVRATNSEGSSIVTWILKVGGGKYLYVGQLDTYKTIAAATKAAAPGDTIVVRDGTYTGEANTLANTRGGRGTLPPEGAPGIFSTVMAEHPGAVHLDGQGERAVIYINGSYADRSRQGFVPCPGSYIAIKGFVAGNSGDSAGPIQTNHASHIKIIDCGAFDAPDGCTPISINRSEYVLVEGCYIWGNGRMRLVFYICDYCIMRRNVVRHDRSNEANPIGLYDVYSCQHTRIQNNIAIDSDQYNYYRNYTNSAGVFIDQSGSSNSEVWSAHIDNIFYGNIALNIHNKFTLTQKRGLSDPVKFYNNIGWGMNAIPEGFRDNAAAPIILSPDHMDINQSTFGDWRSPHAPLVKSSGTTTPVTVSGWASTQNITNSIFFNIRDYNDTAAGLFDAIENVAYNNIYRTGPINIKLSTVRNTITRDPTVACLKYLPRIEPGCALQTAGLSGARVGANIMYVRGKSGTLWGEQGYDAEGTTPVWPFAHEELIKGKMGAYSYDNGKLTGARGFCALGQTLTNYIWGYLGNTVPPFGVSAIAGNGLVEISWNPPAGVSRSDIIRYHIYAINAGVRIKKGTVEAGQVLSYIIKGLRGGAYSFIVTAESKRRGESSYSYPVSVKLN